MGRFLGEDWNDWTNWRDDFKKVGKLGALAVGVATGVAAPEILGSLVAYGAETAGVEALAGGAVAAEEGALASGAADVVVPKVIGNTVGKVMGKKIGARVGLGTYRATQAYENVNQIVDNYEDMDKALDAKDAQDAKDAASSDSETRQSLKTPKPYMGGTT